MSRSAGAEAFSAAWPHLVVDNGRTALPVVRAEGRTRVTSPDKTADDRLRALMVGYQDGRRDAFEQLYAVLAPIVRRQLLSLARESGTVQSR